MRQYLLYSSYAHAAILLGIFFLARNAAVTRKPQAYFIDFIGPAAKAVTVQEAAGGPAARAAKTAEEAPAAKTAAKPEPAPRELPTDLAAGGPSKPLPRPSILSEGGPGLFDRPDPAPAAGGNNGQSGLSADFSNFPYPWYITQVRESLWNAWTLRMPTAGALRCTVSFDIARDGSARRISVSRSSGNRLFDHAARGAAEAAAPFPALPDDFFEDELTVHVEFKSTDR
ncbi:MAG TPA: TonB family protein [Elusimicrobiales bacterium]|nr:TonB family protein [Elusimicrobiales bacterium]